MTKKASYLCQLKGHLVQKLLSGHTHPTNCSIWTTEMVDKSQTVSSEHLFTTISQLFLLIKSQLAECRLTGVVLVWNQTDNLFTNTNRSSTNYISLSANN